MSFEDFGVMPELIKGVEEMRWELPRDIQAECIPLILGGGDVMAAAETGSGKTGAFALPLIQVTYEALMGTAQAGPVKVIDPDRGVVLNFDDRQLKFAISDDGLLGQSRDEQMWCGARATVGVVKGKHYYEATCTDEGLCRVGWSTKAASFDLGTDAGGFGYGGTGKASNRRQFNEYGQPYKCGDIIGCCLDCDKGEIRFTKNGVDMGLAFTIPEQQRGFALYPAVVLKNAEMSFNFGKTPFKNLPQGYKGIASATSEEMQPIGGGAVAGGRKKRNPLVLIIEPTRELAEQTHDQIMLFKKFLPPPNLEAVLLVGGGPVKDASSALKKGADIVTATPGRLKDFIETGKLDLSEVRHFVLDEADRLLDASTLPDIRKFYEAIPKSGRRLQVLMFSATLHSETIRKVSEEFCQFPTWVDLKGKDSVPETVYHAAVFVDPTKNADWVRSPSAMRTDGVHQKDKLVKRTTNIDELSYSEGIKMLKPILLVKIIEAHKMDQALIFVRTRLEADNLQRFLSGYNGQGKQRGMLQEEYSCATLHSGKGPDRKVNLEKFKDGEVRFLICTDVAARGLDIKELPYVINYTLPDNPEEYIHRVGRVGRAERMGLAISLIGAGKEKVWYHKCKSKGSNCSDTRLLDNGGCCIWFDEPAYSAAIEERLREKFQVLDDNFQLPSASGVIFGEKKDDIRSMIRNHVEQLRPAVAELAVMESQVQHNYWDLKSRFNGVMKTNKNK